MRNGSHVDMHIGIYVGHIIDKDGLHLTEDKVRAIKEAPKPRNISELRSFLVISYQTSRWNFEKDTKWTWGRKQNEAFKAAKSVLQDD